MSLGRRPIGRQTKVSGQPCCFLSKIFSPNTPPALQALSTRGGQRDFWARTRGVVWVGSLPKNTLNRRTRLHTRPSSAVVRWRVDRPTPNFWPSASHPPPKAHGRGEVRNRKAPEEPETGRPAQGMNLRCQSGHRRLVKGAQCVVERPCGWCTVGGTVWEDPQVAAAAGQRQQQRQCCR